MHYIIGYNCWLWEQTHKPFFFQYCRDSELGTVQLGLNPGANHNALLHPLHHIIFAPKFKLLSLFQGTTS